MNQDEIMAYLARKHGTPKVIDVPEVAEKVVEPKVDRRFGKREPPTHCKRGHERNEENFYFYNYPTGLVAICKKCQSLTKKQRRKNVQRKLAEEIVML